MDWSDARLESINLAELITLFDQNALLDRTTLMGHLAPPMGPSTALEVAALERALQFIQ